MHGTDDVWTARLRGRLGPRVLCAVVSPDGDEAELWPEERAAVGRAVVVRRREFAAGRACARRLLSGLGLAPAAITVAPDRSPAWPEGVTGSITHSRRLCAVAVARMTDVASLGLDTEPDEPLEEALWERVLTARELAALRALPAGSRGRVARRVFSAKECTYKCLRAALGASPGFHDVEVALDPDAAGFTATLRAAPAGARPARPAAGCQLVHAGDILSAMLLPAPGGGPRGPARRSAR